MLDRLPPRRDPKDAIAIHEAAYAVAGRVLGVAVRPPRFDQGVRRGTSGVMAQWPNTPELMEQAAVVLWAGHYALAKYGNPLGNGRDDVQAREQVHYASMARHGQDLHTPSVLREARNRCLQLAKQAEALVEANWAEIEVIAATLKTP